MCDVDHESAMSTLHLGLWHYPEGNSVQNYCTQLGKDPGLISKKEGERPLGVTQCLSARR